MRQAPQRGRAYVVTRGVRHEEDCTLEDPRNESCGLRSVRGRSTKAWQEDSSLLTRSPEKETLKIVITSSAKSIMRRLLYFKNMFHMYCNLREMMSNLIHVQNTYKNALLAMCVQTKERNIQKLQVLLMARIDYRHHLHLGQRTGSHLQSTR